MIGTFKKSLNFNIVEIKQLTVFIMRRDSDTWMYAPIFLFVSLKLYNFPLLWVWILCIFFIYIPVIVQ